MVNNESFWFKNANQVIAFVLKRLNYWSNWKYNRQYFFSTITVVNSDRIRWSNSKMVSILAKSNCLTIFYSIRHVSILQSFKSHDIYFKTVIESNYQILACRMQTRAFQIFKRLTPFFTLNLVLCLN